MIQLQTLIFHVALLATLFSCDDHQDQVANDEVKIDIYESTFPTEALVNQDVEIQLKAQAINACYSNIRMILTEGDNKNFVVEATADFRTNGVCADMIVYKDGVINFKPTSPGTYAFQVNQAPFK